VCSSDLSIICISSFSSELACVKGLFTYPVVPWQPDFLQLAGLVSVDTNRLEGIIRYEYKRVILESSLAHAKYEQLKSDYEQLKAEKGPVIKIYRILKAMCKSIKRDIRPS
jgi:hypothetical protein